MDKEQITALVARLKMAHRHGALDYGDLFEMCEEAAETIEALHKRLEWQPMETAPKDGGEILIRELGMRFIAAWKKGAWRDNDTSLFAEPFKYPDGWMPLPEVE